jgi:hypothetical protein
MIFRQEWIALGLSMQATAVIFLPSVILNDMDRTNFARA